MKADKRLYYTADRERLVEEDDPKAAFLAYPEGEDVSEEDAKKLPKETKQVAAPPANKQVAQPPATKSVGGR